MHAMANKLLAHGHLFALALKFAPDFSQDLLFLLQQLLGVLSRL